MGKVNDCKFLHIKALILQDEAQKLTNEAEVIDEEIDGIFQSMTEVEQEELTNWLELQGEVTLPDPPDMN